MCSKSDLYSITLYRSVTFPIKLVFFSLQLVCIRQFLFSFSSFSHFYFRFLCYLVYFFTMTYILLNFLILTRDLSFCNLLLFRCGPCKVISPKFEEMSITYTNAVFLKVDVDEVPSVAEACGIRAMPTFQFYKDGKKVAEVVGADAKELSRKLEEVYRTITNHRFYIYVNPIMSH